MLLHKVCHRFSLLHPPPLLSLSRPSPLLRFRRRLLPMRALSSSSSFPRASAAPENAASASNGAAPASSSKDDAAAENPSLGIGYRLPPKEIRDIIDAPPLPALSFSPRRDRILFLKRRALPPLEELARPEEKLAGLCIDASCNGRSRMSFYTGIVIHRLLDDGELGPAEEVRGFPDGEDQFR